MLRFVRWLGCCFQRAWPHVLRDDSMDEQHDLEFLRELGQQLRVDSVRTSAPAGSGHPTSSMWAADLMAVLFARHLRYDASAPGDANNDRGQTTISVPP